MPRLQLLAFLCIVGVVLTVDGVPSDGLAAPYTLTSPGTVACLYKAASELLAKYVFRLAYFAENCHTLSTSAQSAALDHLMEVFCNDTYFAYFRGPDPPYQTTKAGVRSWYLGLVSTFNGVFQLKTSSLIVHNITVLSGTGSCQVLTLNLTAVWENRSRINGLSTVIPNPPTGEYADSIGHYEHQVVVLADGTACFSRFGDNPRLTILPAVVEYSYTPITQAT